MKYINGESIGFLLFFIGIYGLIARRNIIKTVISIGIMQVGVILYFLAADNPSQIVPPIGLPAEGMIAADPLPQALMITDIVIGVGVTAAALTMFIHLYHKYGTTNWLKAKKKRME